MAYVRVEDVPAPKGYFVGRDALAQDSELKVSREGIALTVWRCSHCRALAVGHKDEVPKAPCGKCKQP